MTGGPLLSVMVVRFCLDLVMFWWYRGLLALSCFQRIIYVELYFRGGRCSFVFVSAIFTVYLLLMENKSVII